MNNATRTTVSTIGVMAAIAGIEHGIGEILQGNVASDGMVIESWRGSELFAILAGEPAMTLVPNLLITGILAIVVSLCFLVWVTRFIDRKHGGLTLILLSAVLLLVGGGFGPPVLGIILGVAATRINAPLTWWRSHLPDGVRRLLRALWPWSFVASLIAWLFLFPGTILLDYFMGVTDPELVVYSASLSAFGLLLLTIFAGFAYDIERQPRKSGLPFDVD